MTAVVTGGSTGIGAAICQKFLDAGYEVVSIARRKPADARCLHVEADLFDPVATAQAARDVAARHAISHVIHNAGVIRASLLPDVAPEDIASLAQLHLTAAQIQFTPHLLPIPRGILSTIYVRLAAPGSIITMQACLDEFYADAPMVRVRRSPMLPQIQHVVRTGFCDLGFQLAPDGRRLVLISCLDNLLKGAASQAVQNMNLMAGFHESEGLR